MNKCKGCKWYGKPYWSIVNPCDNCPRENTNVEIFTRWQDPTIEELKTQLQQKENIIKEVREYITSAIENDDIEELKSARHLMLWNEDLDKLLEILDKGE